MISTFPIADFRGGCADPNVSYSGVGESVAKPQWTRWHRWERFAASAVALALWGALVGIPSHLLASLPDISLASPKKALAIDGAGERDGSIRAAAVRCEALLRFGRLIPEDATAEQIRQLVQILKPGGKADGEGIRALMDTFPPADQLLFDGEGYEGGNFGFIDAIIGAQGRPIAFDREPPMFLVPLTAGAEEALCKKRDAFQTRRNPRVLREVGGDAAPAEDATGGASPADMMFEDGEFLRPYCGRFDDLYFHLYQNGNAVSALAFSAVADGLSERRYHPLMGLVDQKAGPPERFDLNDILSDGGLSAIRTYGAQNGARETTAFKGFAYRVVPLIVKRVGAASPGDILKVDSADALRAMRSGQRLYPTRVPPLYLSPDRFLGWTGSFCIPVVNGVSLPQQTMDSYCPLPNRNPDDGDETRAGNSGVSDRLFQSSSTNQLNWEDPQDSDLLSDARESRGRKRSAEKSPAPATRTSRMPGAKNRAGFMSAPRPSDLVRGDSQTGRSASGSGAQPEPPSENESHPSKEERTHSVPPTRLIAVVTPDTAETVAYFSAIQSNDDRLRAAEQMLGRAQRLRSELKVALSSLPEESGEDLTRTIADDLASLDRNEREIRSELLNALSDRASVRTLLERRLLEERIAPLRALGKKEEKAGSPR